MNELILHIQEDYGPGQPTDIHMGLLESGRYRSELVVDRVLPTGAPMPPFSHFIRAGEVGVGIASRIASKIDRLTGFSTSRLASLSARLIASSKPSLLHVHFGTTGALLSDLGGASGIPYIVSFYGADASQAIRDPTWQKRYKRMFIRANRIIVLCDEVRTRMEGLGCPREKITIWNHPLDLSYYPYLEHSASRQVRFITAARFVEKKGYPVLLEALAELVRRGYDAHLAAIGYGPQRAKVLEIIERLELSKRVTLQEGFGHNFHQKYSELLRRSDIFVLPSQAAKDGDDEGGPALSLVCAQAAGLPVICTPFPGAEITVRDGISGFLVPAGDPGALANRMSFLADHQELWPDVGLKGSRIAHEEFELRKQIERLETIYSEVMPVAQ